MAHFVLQTVCNIANGLPAASFFEKQHPSPPAVTARRSGVNAARRVQAEVCYPLARDSTVANFLFFNRCPIILL
jgi:hypothetical protein